MRQFVPFFLTLLFFVQARPLFPQENPAPQTYPPRAILNAAYSGDLDLIKAILATNPDKNVRDALGGTALHIAILQNNLEVLSLLLENGFDINAAVPADGYAPLRGYTPLHYCVWINNVAAARILVAWRADKNIKAADGMTPAEKAAKEGKRDILLVLSRR